MSGPVGLGVLVREARVGLAAVPRDRGQQASHVDGLLEDGVRSHGVGDLAGLRRSAHDDHSEIAQAREKAISVAAEIQALELEVLPGAKSAYDAAIVGFENGKFNFLEVLDAQRTYLAAKSQYLKAVAEAHRAAADMARLLGNSFPTGQSTPLN